MHELKRLSGDAVARAVEKARHYRLLNAPRLAESICLDVLEIDAANQEVLSVLVLALADQFQNSGVAVSRNRVEDILPRISDDYQRTYLEGLVAERRAFAALGQHTPGYMVHGWFTQAMAAYDKAMKIAPEGNDDAVLRWNTCARILNRNPSVRPTRDEVAATGD